MSENKIFGIVGPSGIGKGYIKGAILNAFPNEFVEPIVVTTRERRPTDGNDRLNVDLAKFCALVDNRDVIFQHQPYGSNGAWYGFLQSSLTKAKKHVLTEVHVENIEPFRSEYGNRLFLLGLTSTEAYLQANLEGRGERASEQLIRLSTAVQEVNSIKKFEKDGSIDEILEVGDETRKIIDQLVINIAVARLSLTR